MGMFCSLLVHQTDMAVLQCFAWVTMVAEYSIEESSLTEGVEKTFSGKSPCGLCSTIEKFESEPSSQAPAEKAPKSLKKENLSTFLNSESPGWSRLLGRESRGEQMLFGRYQEEAKNQFYLSPPTPPPRTMDSAPEGLYI